MTRLNATRTAFLGAAALLASGMSAGPAAQASPLAAGALTLQHGPDLVETVQARRKPARRVVRARRGNNAAAGAALAIGVLGAAAAIAATQHREPRYYGGPQYYDPGYQPGYVYGRQPTYYYQADPYYERQQRWEQRRAYDAQIQAQQRAQWQAQQRAQWQAQQQAQWEAQRRAQWDAQRRQPWQGREQYRPWSSRNATSPGEWDQLQRNQGQPGN